MVSLHGVIWFIKMEIYFFTGYDVLYCAVFSASVTKGIESACENADKPANKNSDSKK